MPTDLPAEPEHPAGSDPAGTGLPAGLPARAYLIGYDVERQKLTGAYQALLVRAAALAELSVTGRLTDEKGKAHDSGRRTDDPILDAVLDRIAGSKPRVWMHWVMNDPRTTLTAVRERLADQRLIATQEGAVLGIFPRTVVTVPDTRTVRALIADTRAAVLDGTPVERLDPRRAALVALVAAAELNTVFSGRERREHRQKIKEITERSGPAAKALRQAVDSSNNA